MWMLERGGDLRASGSAFPRSDLNFKSSLVVLEGMNQKRLLARDSGSCKSRLEGEGERDGEGTQKKGLKRKEKWRGGGGNKIGGETKGTRRWDKG